MSDINEGFSRFLTQYPKKMDQVMLPPAQIKKITTTVCAEYGKFLQEHGIAGYDKGFIWSVNPLDYKDVLRDFTSLDPKKVHVVARTAFGDLLLWNGKEGLLLQVNHNRLTERGPSIRSLYNLSLTHPEILKGMLKRDLFDKALKTLGPLTHDECYGYFLAPSLGGVERVDNLQKVKLIPYLSMLAQA